MPGAIIAVKVTYYSPALQRELLTKIYGIKITKQLMQCGELSFRVSDVVAYEFTGRDMCAEGHPVFVYRPELEIGDDYEGLISVDISHLP